MPKFVDTEGWAEDKRIDAIAAAAAGGKIVGFLVDDDRVADRYIQKLGDRVSFIDRRHATADRHGVVLVRVGPSQKNVN